MLWRLIKHNEKCIAFLSVVREPVTLQVFQIFFKTVENLTMVYNTVLWLCILYCDYVYCTVTMYTVLWLCILYCDYAYCTVTYVYCTVTEVFLNLTEVFLTLTEVFPCFFLSCKANAKVKLAMTGHGSHSTTLVCICVILLLFVLFYVLFVCKCVLPPGDNPIAVNK
jgi:hypothetical protein